MTNSDDHGVTMTRYPTYDGNKVTERPVRLDKTEGHVIIEGKTYPAREIVEALAQSGYAEIRSSGDSLILGTKRITPIFKSRQERAMASLCHGSLSYCCPLSKRCAERDRALEVMGFTPDEYEEMKTDSHIRFVEMARGMGTTDSSWSQQTTSERMANRPAVDPGYGSDDYRRDFECLDRTMESLSEHYDRGPDSWRDQKDDRYSYQYREREREKEHQDVYSDLQRAVPAIEEASCGICNAQRDDSIEGIGALFAQGELSPFLDDKRDEPREHIFCFSCGRDIKPGNRICPYCGARQ